MWGGSDIKNTNFILFTVLLIVIIITLSGCISCINGTTRSGQSKQIVYGPDDGSSSSRWTAEGASIDMGMGDPTPSFKTTNDQYMYKNVGLAPNMVIEFDAYINNHRDQLGDFSFLCDGTGKGNALVLEGRQDYHATSLTHTYNWTARIPSDDTGFTTPTEQWVHVKIVLGSTTGDLYINYTDNKGNQCSFSQKNWAFDNNGGYLGFDGNAGMPHTVWWDNLVVYRQS